jgi:SGT1 protein
VDLNISQFKKKYGQIQACKDAIQHDPEYTEYIKSIHAAGYFRDEIEGSQFWNELEIKALEVFLQSRRRE